MVRKLKSLKGKTFRKTDFVELDNGVTLPIKNLSITEDRTISFTNDVKIPKKVRPATDEEQNLLTLHDKTYNKKTYPMIAEYDETSSQFQELVERKTKLDNLITVLKFVDFDFKIEDEDGNEITLWEDCGVKKGDWISIAEYFGDTLCITETDLHKILTAANALKGETMYKLLEKLQKISHKSPMEILFLLEKFDVDKALEEDKDNVVELNEELEEEKGE